MCSVALKIAFGHVFWGHESRPKNPTFENVKNGPKCQNQARNRDQHPRKPIPETFLKQFRVSEKTDFLPPNPDRKSDKICFSIYFFLILKEILVVFDASLCQIEWRIL